jgi:tripartite-type tricarboxylate transporter receptor subunit TctC
MTAYAIAVNKESPFNSLDELLAAAKKNPGRLTYGNAGAGLYHHLFMAGFLHSQGVDMTHVPYNGGAEALAALLGGHIDCSIQVTAEYLSNYRAKQLKVLVTTGPEREAEYPDVPTMKELGYQGTTTWTGFLVPKKTPDNVVQKLDDIIKEALSTPEVRAQYKKRAISINYAGHQELTKTMYHQYKENKKLLENLGMVEK